MPSSEDMKAPSTVAPQISAPSQKRQIGAARKACCHDPPSVSRLAETPPCIHGSHTLRKSRGANTAMKSLLAASFPNRLQRMAGALNSSRATKFPQSREIQRIAHRARADLIAHELSVDREDRGRGFLLRGERALLEHAEHRPRAGLFECRCGRRIVVVADQDGGARRRA